MTDEDEDMNEDDFSEHAHGYADIVQFMTSSKSFGKKYGKLQSELREKVRAMSEAWVRPEEPAESEAEGFPVVNPDRRWGREPKSSLGKRPPNPLNAEQADWLLKRHTGQVLKAVKRRFNMPK